MELVPQWTERISDRDVVGEDHLGIETAAINYQGSLLPGIITVTDHARYYSLYCWILWRFIYDDTQERRLSNLKGSYFKRMELAHTMACYAHHEEDKGLEGVIGSQRSGAIWREARPNPIDLEANINRYFQNELGGFGQYYLAALRFMGLLGEQINQRDVYQLTKRGEALAKAYEDSIANSRYFAALSEGAVNHLSYKDALDYGEVACLCVDALAKGKDRDLLREVLFRLEDGKNIEANHKSRQLSLSLLLDMVRQSGNAVFQESLRSVLYLGKFSSKHSYEPLASLRSSYQRWHYVQVRQLYTNAVQILWHIFLDYLQNKAAHDGILFEEFILWIEHQSSSDLLNMTLNDYIASKLHEAGYETDWSVAEAFVKSIEFKNDALSLFDKQVSEKAYTVQQVVDMLCELFLRCYPYQLNEDPLWKEFSVANQESHRLPMSDFFKAFEGHLNANRSFRDLLDWLYRDYILSQHEYIAIRKLRYNHYDTFKFHYREGRFYHTAKAYQQPIRHPGLRLNNALTMLIDVGLVDENQGICQLTADGHQYLGAVEELNHGN
jgi:hypothetical protein